MKRGLLAFVVVGLLVGFKAYSMDELTLTVSDAFRLANKHQISGAFSVKDKLFTVQNNEDAKIYQVVQNKDAFSLLPYIDLTQLVGYYSYIKSIPQKQKFALEGIASCGQEFYLINKVLGDVIKINQPPMGSRQMSRMEFDPNGFANFQTTQKGFNAIAVDCKSSTLFLSQKQTNQTNVIFGVDLQTQKIKQTIPLSNTSKTDLDDISDLYFHQSTLYALQKNRASILAFSPQNPQNMKRYSFKQYTDLFERTKVANKPFAENITGGFVVQNDSVLLFYQQDDTVGVVNQRAQDLLNLAPTDQGLFLELK